MTKEQHAERGWKYLIRAGRETMTLKEFTAKTNDYTGNDYEPRELRVAFEKLRRKGE